MRLLLLAGEESGVLYARRLEAVVRRRVPDAEIRGYGDYGFQTGDLAVMGFWPVLRKLFFFLGVKRTMERAIDDWRPDVVCTIDYPGLNLKLAAYAKSRGIRTVHVVCPQVWAWKKGRIPKIEAALDHLCCFFPFEPQYFKPGFAEFVGHPLAAEFASSTGKRSREPRRAGVSPAQQRNFEIPYRGGEDASSTGKRLVALLPGSRLGEIERNLPVMLAALARLEGVHAIIPAANEKAQSAIASVLANSPIRQFANSPIRQFSNSPILPFANSPIRQFSNSPIRQFANSPIRQFSHSPIRQFANSPIRQFSNSPIRQFSHSPIRQFSNSSIVSLQLGGARELLLRADCAVVASGTATLEAALARCPTVLVYRVSPLLAWFARRVIRGIAHIGLINIIWEKNGAVGEEPMPELLQEAFTAEAVADRLRPWLADPAARQAAVDRLDATARTLGTGADALDRIAARL